MKSSAIYQMLKASKMTSVEELHHHNKKEIAIEADDISDDSSDSEGGKSNKQQKYLTLPLDVGKKRTGKEENVEDALHLERENVSSRNPSSEKQSKDVDFAESKGRVHGYCLLCMVQ